MVVVVVVVSSSLTAWSSPASLLFGATAALFLILCVGHAVLLCTTLTSTNAKLGSICQHNMLHSASGVTNRRGGNRERDSRGPNRGQLHDACARDEIEATLARPPHTGFLTIKSVAIEEIEKVDLGPQRR